MPENRLTPASWMLLALMCTTGITDAQAMSEKLTVPTGFDIPAQALGLSLKQLADQAGIQILFEERIVRGLNAPALRSNQSALQALVVLLSDTGLEYTAQNETVAVRVKAPPAATPPRTDASTPGLVLEEVVVTAIKRAQAIKDVPGSVTAVTGNLLEHLQAHSLQDYADYIPGLQVQATGAGVNRLILRGLSSGPNDLTGTVGVYVDDVPFGSSTGVSLSSMLSPDMDPFDLQRVEVLRGPQGTLYGASTLGGLVKYVHTSPDLYDYQASMRFNAGFTDESSPPFSGSARLAVNAPVIEGKLGVRASGFYTYVDGDMTDLATGRDHVNTVRLNGGRIAALYKPGAAWTLSASVDRHDNSQPDTVSMQADPVTLVPIYGERIGLTHVKQSTDLRYTVYQGTVDWDGPVRVTSSTGYSDFKWQNMGDLTGTYQTVSPFFLSYSGIGSSLDSSTNKFTEELRVASRSGEHFDWLLGGFYTHERSIYVSNILGFMDRDTLASGAVAGIPRSAVLLATNKVSYREHAAFGDLTWHVTPTLDTTIGARYSSNSQSRDTASFGILNLFSAPFAVSSTRQGTSEESVWTYEANARWRPTDNGTYYVRAARGYRPGGVLFPDPLVPNSPTQYLSDTVWNYEVGAKGSALNGALQGDIAAFYIDWTDIQLNYFGADGRTKIGNGGGATSKGVELQGSYMPIERLTLAGNAAYTRTRLTSIDAATSIATGAAVGDELPFNPQWTAALRADYVFPLWGDDTGNVGGAYRYKAGFSATFPGDTGTRGYRLPATQFFDLRAGVSHGRLDFALQVLNVFNEHVLMAASLFGAAVATNPAVIGYTPARSVTLSVQARF